MPSKQLTKSEAQSDAGRKEVWGRGSQEDSVFCESNVVMSQGS